MGESQSRLCARGRTGRPRRPGPAGRNYRGGGCVGGAGAEWCLNWEPAENSSEPLACN